MIEIGGAMMYLLFWCLMYLYHGLFACADAFSSRRPPSKKTPHKSMRCSSNLPELGSNQRPFG